MRVSFSKGTHYGYRFDTAGNVTASQRAYFAKTSPAEVAATHTPVANRSGYWFEVTTGALDGYWVQLSGIIVDPAPQLAPVQPPPPEPEPEPEPPQNIVRGTGQPGSMIAIQRETSVRQYTDALFQSWQPIQNGAITPYRTAGLRVIDSEWDATNKSPQYADGRYYTDQNEHVVYGGELVEVLELTRVRIDATRFNGSALHAYADEADAAYSVGVLRLTDVTVLTSDLTRFGVYLQKVRELYVNGLTILGPIRSPTSAQKYRGPDGATLKNLYGKHIRIESSVPDSAVKQWAGVTVNGTPWTLAMARG